ncbi:MULTISPECIES: hypothetical protein [Bacillus]|uniref:hypothetical protein n=1 Tax=Bacillus TaxID=1386 RepID=UPI001F5B499F|nr:MULTISPECIES: hypothetical protein [Bacillus]
MIELSLIVSSVNVFILACGPCNSNAICAAEPLRATLSRLSTNASAGLAVLYNGFFI